MSKAVAVGEKHLIQGFRGVGFEIRPIEDSSRLGSELFGLSRDPEVGFVLVTESVADGNPQAVREFRLRSAAVLTIIPTHEGGRHVSFEEIRRSVERSMGIDILGKDTNQDDQG